MRESDLPGTVPLPQLALLAAIVDSSFDGVISKTLDGTITSWNAAATRIFGYTAAQAIGHQIAMLVPPELRDEEAWILGQLRAGERVENFETVRIRMDGRRIAVAITSSPVRNAEGEIVGASKLVRDVSAQRAAASALAESEERLAAIVESAMDAIISVDDQGRIVVFNEAAVEMLRCPREQAVGGSMERFLPEPHRQAHLSWMTAFGAGGLTSRSMGSPGRIDACRADGSSFPAEASISHVQVLGQQLYTVILRDVSELRQAQAARRALEEQLREAQKMEAVGTLAGGIAHDVNNALGSILANAALAREDLAEDHAARVSVDQVEVAAQRARAVVRQILAFSRRQTQELLVQPLAPLVAEALALLRSTLPSVVRLESEVSDPGLYVRADANQLHQVLLNLCTNAWHALRGSTGRIRVGVERVVIDAVHAQALDAIEPGPYARLWVGDDGCGMDAATRARIFEPFFTTKPRGEGTGLGLAVVHGIVHAHGGAIAVQSEPGVGTLFSIYLPEALAEEGRDRAPAGDAAELAVSGQGRRVAYVDDDEMMLLVVERLLQRRGFEIDCYADPRALLDHLRSQPGRVDIVVSDFNMPVMNGIELARALADLGLPVIVSSGYISEELRDNARAAGVSALLEKEDTLERLAPLVASVLARRERDRETPHDPPEA
jgi:PAS domain S-box-containing protein